MKVSQARSRVTLAMVAERAGVSIATVSLILSDREEKVGLFHPDTVRRVRAAAMRLGYRANLFASGLPARSSSFFALVVHDLPEGQLGNPHHWPFEGSLIVGAMQAAVEAGLYPVLATAHGTADAAALDQVVRIIDGGVFGTVVRTPGPVFERLLRKRLQRGHPIVVLFPHRLASWRSNAIDVDNVAIGETAGTFLQEHHRKRWLVVGYRELRDSLRLRLRGLRAVAARARVQVRQIRLPLQVDEARAAALLVPHLARHRPDGVFGMDSIASAGALLACLQGNVRLGDDLDLIGCDCWPMHPPDAPRITSIDISWMEAGRNAIQRLIGLAEAGKTRFDSTLLKPRVVPGETCRVSDRLPPTSRQ